VRTLHGLAHDIVREKPASVGLETQFSIIDEREREESISDSKSCVRCRTVRLDSGTGL